MAEYRPDASGAAQMLGLAATCHSRPVWPTPPTPNFAAKLAQFAVIIEKPWFRVTRSRSPCTHAVLSVRRQPCVAASPICAPPRLAMKRIYCLWRVVVNDGR